MPIEVAALATTIVSSFLVPYLKKGVEKLATELTDTASKSAAEHVSGVAGKVWDKVKGIFTSEPDKQTLDLFAQRPETFQEAVAKELKAKLDADPALAAEFEKLINMPVPGTSSTSVQIMGNSGLVGNLVLSGANFSHSTDARLSGLTVSYGADSAGEGQEAEASIGSPPQPPVARRSDPDNQTP